MSPSILLDNIPDFGLSTKPLSPSARTLLLAPPRLAAHEEGLRNILSGYDRTVTELQMLDRVSAGLVTLPQETYDLIIILSDPDSLKSELNQLLDRRIFQQIFQALKTSGKLQAQNGLLAKDHASVEFREAILSGLVLEDGELVKPNNSVNDVVPIKLLRAKDRTMADSPPTLSTSEATVRSSISTSTYLENSNRKNEGASPPAYSDHDGKFSVADDDEFIDEDTLLTEEEMQRPLRIRM